jgi:hypothetical protein
MMKKVNLAFGPGVVVRSVVFQENQWFVSADGGGERSCLTCGRASASRHSWHVRRLQDPTIQGAPVVLALRLGRWRCLNEACARKTFVERLKTAFPFARKAQRVTELVRLFGHAAGARKLLRPFGRLGEPWNKWRGDSPEPDRRRQRATNVVCAVRAFAAAGLSRARLNRLPRI